MKHEIFLHRCLHLAEQGRGKVGNGVMVGAVLVRDGTIIAEGFHEGFGKVHAERHLLQKYVQKISTNDILYVNLEPCCHHGKTPPCTDILIDRGIKNVVFGMRDPDSRVAGKGIELLRSKGINVIGPCIPDECARFNRGFVSVRTKHRPWITLREAITVDGKVANPDGSPLKITGKEQDAWTHANLRAKHDAILVGVGTIITDNPRLTIRNVENPPRLYRIILDPHLRIPHASKVLTDEHAKDTIVIADPDIVRRAPEKLDPIIRHGAHVLPVGTDTPGNVIFEELWKALMTPSGDYHGVTSILLEGGPRTWELFKKAGMVDEEVVLIGKAE